MFYEYRLTIPANTPSSAPLESSVELDHGRIVGVEIQFPPGCVGLVHGQIRRERHQLWPTNVDGDISGDDARIGWVEDYDLDEEPYVVTLRGWNEDDSFSHTITFRFNVLSPSPPPAPPVSSMEGQPISTLELE